MHTHNASLQQTLVHLDKAFLLIPVAEAHELCIMASGVHTAHDTLIISKEKDRQAGDGVDGNQQGALLQPIGDIVLGNKIHDGHDGVSFPNFHNFT